jgi:hypothetical protein
VVTLTTSPAPAPAPSGSAPAELTRAAVITAAQNYRVTSHIVPVPPAFGTAVTITGAFDPARGMGAESIDGIDSARYDGHYLYLRILPNVRKYYEQNLHVTLRPSQIWERITEPRPNRSRYALMIRLQFGSVETVQVLSPQGLVALLKGARHVRDTGRVSGPGWTGTAYSFQLSASITPGHSDAGANILTLGGIVDVDQHDRIRSLAGLATSRYARARRGDSPTVDAIALTFSGFGRPIPASVPPAGQVVIGP